MTDRVLGRRAALGLAVAAPVAAARPAHAAEPCDRPRRVRRLRAEGEIGRVRLSWEHDPYEPLVDHYAIYGSRSAGFEVGSKTLLGRIVYASFTHTGLGGRAQDWHYRVMVVDAAGRRSLPSAEVPGASTDSVALTGRPVATIGAFDNKSLEMAMAPDGYGVFPSRFPKGADFTYGVHRASTHWPYIHPGPGDLWGGRRPYRFIFRFALDAPPAAELWLSIWVLDTHAAQSTAIDLGLNGAPVKRVTLERGGSHGYLEGDATVRETMLKPSYVELPLPRSALVVGQNVLTIDKNAGSWHVYDALGVFERRS